MDSYIHFSIRIQMESNASRTQPDRHHDQCAPVLHWCMGTASVCRTYHHATELPNDDAVCDLRGKVVVACVDQYDAVGIEDEVALEQIVTFVQPT